MYRFCYFWCELQSIFVKGDVETSCRHVQVDTPRVVRKIKVSFYLDDLATLGQSSEGWICTRKGKIEWQMQVSTSNDPGLCEKIRDRQ